MVIYVIVTYATLIALRVEIKLTLNINWTNVKISDKADLIWNFAGFQFILSLIETNIILLFVILYRSTINRWRAVETKTGSQ